MMKKFKIILLQLILGLTSFVVLGYMIISQQPQDGEITFITTDENKHGPKFTLLHIANFVYSAENGDIKTVTKYIDLGIDVNSQDHNKDTALMGATLNGHSDIVALLLLKNADPNIKNEDGYSAFDFSEIRGEPKLTAELISHQLKLRSLSSTNAGN